MLKRLKTLIYLVIGIVCASIGLRAFLIPNGFFDGGVMGVALLFQRQTGLNLSLLIIFLNLPFVIMSARQFSLKFALKSAFSIGALALCVHWLSLAPVTEDRLLVSVFGGFFLGLGIGMTIRGGAVIDGTEILALSISRQTTFTVGDFIAVFNFALFLFVALLVNVQTAMYSMLTYFAASKTVDFVINGIEEYIGVTIISPQFERIQKVLTEDLGRGVTVYKTEGGYGKTGSTTERKTLFCVVTRLEVSRLINEVDRIDPEAFVIQHSIRDTRGGMIKKRKVHSLG